MDITNTLLTNLHTKFGEIGTPRIYFSPGRVNLIGEHTDYNNGYVFPCALQMGTYLAIQKNHSQTIRFASAQFNFEYELTLNDTICKVNEEWVNYPLGVMEIMKNDYGLKPEGMDLYYHGNIPNGAGLSSSASIEVVTAFAMNELFNLNLSKVELAKIGQRAENEFVGMNCGIMDQFAVALGKKDNAVFLNCDTLKYTHAKVELNKHVLIISNTNKPRKLVDSKYNERRAECEEAVKRISAVKPIKHLSKIKLADFDNYRAAIADTIIEKRAYHVVSENQRVLNSAKYLAQGKLELFGKLMNESHNSLRDNYEVTGNELDTLVNESRKLEGVLGSRMTGAGFGGCTVSLVHKDSIENFKTHVAKTYKDKTGLTPDFYISEISDGVRKLL